MNQNTFCKYCHRIPSQCSCVPAKTLTDEEIFEIGRDCAKNPDRNFQITFARAILRKAQEK
jgi:hypothetical protein